MTVITDWYWEGNVADAIANGLAKQGWTIVSKADTESKARGIDIHAVKEKRSLLVEVKGFPSTAYRDPRRASERKPTNPNNQAQHWYSHALLKVMRLQTTHTESIVAIGLPDFPRYRKLFAETRIALQKLEIVVLFLDASGQLEFWGLN
jgi:hypothetical protein